MMRPLWNQIVGWLLAAIVVIGNGLVIYLITTRRKLRTTTNWFVLSLAVADFGVGVCVGTLHATVQHEIKSYNNGAVQLVLLYTLCFFIFASVINLCVLTLDRYLAIVKPLRYVTFMTKTRVALLVCAAWNVAFLGIIPYVVLSAGRYNHLYMEKYTLILSGLLYFSVFVFLLFATARIFLIARKHSRQNAAVIKQLNFNHALHCKVPAEPQEAAAAKMIFIVVAVFVSYSLLNIYTTFRGPNKTIYILRGLLLLTNCAVNPIAYAYFKREIRKELKRLFCHGTFGWARAVELSLFSIRVSPL